MKKTAVLQLVYSYHQHRDIVYMHPNAGFELDLMTKSHKVVWSHGVGDRDFLAGQDGVTKEMTLELINECPHDQLRLHTSANQALGEATKAVVFLDGNRLYIHTL